MTKRTASSRAWLKEHFTDPYVQQAQKLGYRSRASFKLLEIQEKDLIIKPGMTIVDLGAAPGGWSQIAMHLLKDKGKVIALDILPMQPLAGVDFIQGDFREESVLKQLEKLVENEKIDLVISDMAPNTSGMDAVDQPRAMYLTELALDFALNHLKVGGDFLTKMFQGAGSDDFIKLVRQHFQQVFIRKPKASRARSSEVYILARGKKIR
ncbi:MAG: rRNA ((2552)-2-O)-methyltransferase [Gammaproteobacteria bacterium]|jgi:23S rRNA (uridine2552-2'-O)-methyltransferase|nr:rRNA ((2552)-2-O)-methyltransferase [Gammaproteobacteria bacterium]